MAVTLNGVKGLAIAVQILRFAQNDISSENNSEFFKNSEFSFVQLFRTKPNPTLSKY